MENISPTDDLIKTIKELSFYEYKYGMNSEDFFNKFNKRDKLNRVIKAKKPAK